MPIRRRHEKDQGSPWRPGMDGGIAEGSSRVPGARRATLQPGGIGLPLVPVPGGVAATVPSPGMHAMVVFEE